MAVVWAAAEREVRELAVVVVEESMVDGDGGGNGNDTTFVSVEYNIIIPNTEL